MRHCLNTQMMVFQVHLHFRGRQGSLKSSAKPPVLKISDFHSLYASEKHFRNIDSYSLFPSCYQSLKLICLVLLPRLLSRTAFEHVRGSGSYQRRLWQSFSLIVIQLVWVNIVPLGQTLSQVALIPAATMETAGWTCQCSSWCILLFSLLHSDHKCSKAFAHVICMRATASLRYIGCYIPQGTQVLNTTTYTKKCLELLFL